MITDALRQATIKDLANLNLLCLPFYSARNQQVWTFLRGQGIIDDASIEKALEPAVIAQAKRDYERVVSRGEYPDHVGRPECLAYAIQHNAFTPRQIRRIPFDHGETPETFCKHYGKEDLLARLREELVNPKPLPKSEGYYDEHPACCLH